VLRVPHRGDADVEAVVALLSGAASRSDPPVARLVAFRRHEYSSKVQRGRRYSALSSGVLPRSTRFNEAEF
jgi:hypothetical protein